MSELSYIDIALKTYSGLDILFDAAEKMEWYNSFAVECHQIVEKLLKGVLLEVLSPDDRRNSLISSHDLALLARALGKEYPNFVKIEDCAWLTDYYFDARYPGDNFFVVTREEAQKVKDVTSHMADALITLHQQLNNKHTSYFD